VLAVLDVLDATAAHLVCNFIHVTNVQQVRLGSWQGAQLSCRQERMCMASIWSGLLHFATHQSMGQQHMGQQRNQRHTGAQTASSHEGRTMTAHASTGY
jgi:NAD-dependent DNA ligase